MHDVVERENVPKIQKNIVFKMLGSPTSNERYVNSPRGNSFFFFNAPATTEIYTLSYTLSLHDALPISRLNSSHIQKSRMPSSACDWSSDVRSEEHTSELQLPSSA